MSDSPKVQRRIFPQISLYLTDDQLETAERIVRESGQKRSTVLRDAVAYAFEHTDEWAPSRQPAEASA